MVTITESSIQYFISRQLRFDEQDKDTKQYMLGFTTFLSNDLLEQYLNNIPKFKELRPSDLLGALWITYAAGTSDGRTIVFNDLEKEFKL